jgi:hypothetical protein
VKVKSALVRGECPNLPLAGDLEQFVERPGQRHIIDARRAVAARREHSPAVRAEESLEEHVSMPTEHHELTPVVAPPDAASVVLTGGDD